MSSQQYPKIIACDFDGTLFVDDYPNIGEPIMETINALLEEQKNGTKIILWTIREEEPLAAALRACHHFGLDFNAANDNLPELKDFFGSNPRKIFANEYWDDRAVKIPRDCENGMHRYIEQETIHNVDAHILKCCDCGKASVGYSKPVEYQTNTEKFGVPY